MFTNPRSEAKAAHAAAYLLRKAGGSLEFLKLMRLMYLAERTAYQYHGRPMIGDELCLSRDGPVLAHVYRSAEQGGAVQAGPTWRALIAPRDGNDIDLQDLDAPLKKLSSLNRPGYRGGQLV